MYRLYILDDEAAVVRGLTEAIDWEAYNVEIAGTSTDSVEALNALSQMEVDILVTDVCMPGYDGLTLMKMAMEKNPRLRVIVISAHDSFRYVKSALKNGAENYLLKPIDGEELTETLRKTLDNLETERHGQFSVTAFKSNILDRWLHGGIHENELMERAEMLGIDLHAEGFTPLLFRHPNWTLREAVQAADAIEGHAPGECRVHCCISGSFEVTGIVTGPDEGTEGFRLEMQRLLDAVARIAAASDASILSAEQAATGRSGGHAEPVRLTVGPTVGDPGEVGKAFQLAVKYSCVPDDGTAILYCSSFPEDVADSPGLRELQERLTGKLKDGLREECVRQMDAIRSRLAPETDPQRRVAALVVAVHVHEVLKRDNPGVSVPESFVLLLARFSDTPTKDLPHWLETLATLAIQLLSEKRTRMHPYVQKAVAAIQQEYAGEISLKTIAVRFAVSPAYLGHLFHTQTGEYFNDYLASVRVDTARRLIADTTLRVSEIAERTGFSSQAYFNRVFRRAYGTSPGEYRQQVKVGG